MQKSSNLFGKIKKTILLLGITSTFLLSCTVQKQPHFDNIGNGNATLEPVKSVETSFVCSGGTKAGNTNWVQFTADGIYADVDTSVCGFTTTPIYIASLLGSTNNHWTAKGISSIYNPKSNSFRVYINQTGITTAQANSWNWRINWTASLARNASDLCAGKTVAGNTAWKQYNSEEIYVDVNTSACGFSSLPIYTTSLYGSNHWTTTGASTIHKETATGFRIYINSPGITPAQANSWGWHMNWIASPKINNSNFCAGETLAVQTSFMPYGTEGMYAYVSTSSCGFTTTPIYTVSFAALTDLGPWKTTGATSVYSLSPGLFIIYINFKGITFSQALGKVNTAKFHIQWTAKKETEPIPKPANVKTGTKVPKPYWVQYINSAPYMSTSTKVTYCVETDPWGDCRREYSESHSRSRITDPNYRIWYPFYGPYSGNRPGYYKECNPIYDGSCQFTDIAAIYYTNWYLETDEWSINNSYLQVKKTLWPGEVRTDGWAVVPMSNDILNTTWMALVPPGKTYGANGIVFKNFVTSIDTTGMIKGGGPGPQTGTTVGARSTYRYNSTTGKHEIYITGVNTGCQAYSSAFKCLSGTIQEYNQTIDNFNGEGVWTSNVNAVIQKIKQIKESNPSAKIDLYGHSLGATEATLIYNLKNVNGENFLGSNDRVLVISPPHEIPTEYMKQDRNPANYMAWGGINDIINGRKLVNAKRRAYGVNIQDVDTGSGVLSPHDRNTYQTKVWGNSWW